MDDINIKASADFVIAFAELSKRLAAIDITVSRLHLDYGHFGCWELIATKGNEAVKFLYDGKDRYITVEVSPFAICTAPNQWKQVDAKALREGAIRYAEDFLRKRYGKKSFRGKTIIALNGLFSYLSPHGPRD